MVSNVENFIKGELLKAGYTISDLARELKYDVSYISKVIKGQRKGNDKIWKRISEITGLPLDIVKSLDYIKNEHEITNGVHHANT